MGVKFDRVLDEFSGPFARVVGFARPAVPRVGPAAAGYVFSHSENDAFIAVNRLLAHGQQVYTATHPIAVGAGSSQPGMFFVRGTAQAREIIAELASKKGVEFAPINVDLNVSDLAALHAPRIAIWDQYGGSIDAGWLRFVLEQFEFPYEVVYPKTIDAGNLNAKYDVLILTDDATMGDSASRGRSQREPADVPAEYQPRLGLLTVARSLPQLRAFVENGGTLLTVARAANIAYQLGLPVTNAFADSTGRQLSRSRFYIPGSVLGAVVDTSSAIAWGLPQRVDLFFDSSPAFRMGPEAASRGMKNVAWFDNPAPLRSGWALGQKVLDGASEILVAPIGKGAVVMYGPEIYFRSQSHGSFRFLFNGIYFGQEMQH
jgi:hypothetical protein